MKIYDPWDLPSYRVHACPPREADWTCDLQDDFTGVSPILTYEITYNRWRLPTSGRMLEYRWEDRWQAKVQRPDESIWESAVFRSRREAFAAAMNYIDHHLTERRDAWKALIH